MEPKRLTDDDLRAIRARDEAYAHAYKIWNSQRNPDSDFYDDTPIPHPSAPEDRAALLAHADALAARVAELEAALAEDLARLREDHSRWQVVLWTLLNELSPAVVEELRAVWGNTNTRILEDRIEDARRALEGGA